MNEQIKNYGFIEDELLETDYKLGAKSPLGKHKALVEDSNWSNYLPTGELQKDKDSREDTMACTVFSGENILESIFDLYIQNGMLHIDDYNWLKVKGYFDENGKINFNDRFNSKLSGVSKRGNSLRKAADSFRKDGLIPWSVWKYEPFYNNEPFVWKDYYQKPPKEAIALGKEFLKRFKINYETTYMNPSDIRMAMKISPLHTGVHAWSRPKNGVYPRTNAPLNHAVMGFKPEWFIYDHYKVNGTFVKELAPNFNFLYYAFIYIITPLINPLNYNKTMQLKNNHLYQEVEQSGSFGVAVDNKLIIGDTASILATFIMRNKGDIKGKCIAVKKKDWDSSEHYNPSLQKV